jgi:hypothetical protein
MIVVFQYPRRLIRVGLEMNACLIREDTKSVLGFYENVGSFCTLLQCKQENTPYVLSCFYNFELYYSL